MEIDMTIPHALVTDFEWKQRLRSSDEKVESMVLAICVTKSTTEQKPYLQGVPEVLNRRQQVVCMEASAREQFIHTG